MKKQIVTYLTVALFAMLSADLVAARSDHVKGDSHVNNGHQRINLAKGGHRHGGGGHHRASGGHHRASGGHNRHSGGGHHRHRSHRHSSVSLGINMGGGYYNSGYYGRGYGYGYPYRYYNRPYYYYGRPYYYPPTVVVPSAPTVYIQQESATPAEAQINYWYYCRKPDGYYPYVKQCPDGWLQVAPQPPIK